MPSSFYSALENVDEKTVAPMIGVKIENKLSKPYLELGKQSEPYDLFIFAINAEQTRQKYLTRLNMFFQVIGIDQEKKLSIEEGISYLFEGQALKMDPILNVAFLLIIPVTASYVLMIVKSRHDIVRCS